MEIKKITYWFILTIVILIAGYDLYAIYVGGTEASISQTLISWSYEYPAMTFLMGFTAGHIFWRLKTDKRS